MMHGKTQIPTNPPQAVIIIAGSTERRAGLDAVAAALRSKRAQVEVAAGVETRRVELLKLSFRYRDQAHYLLCGSPELPENELRSVAADLEANGVPGARISCGTLTWSDPATVARQAEDRLAAMGLDLDGSDTAARFPPPRLVNQGIAPPRPPLPSGSVPTLAATPIEIDVEEDDEIPSRFGGKAKLWIAGAIGAAALAVAAVAMSSTDTVDGDDDAQTTAAASVAALPDDDPSDEDDPGEAKPAQPEPEPAAEANPEPQALLAEPVAELDAEPEGSEVQVEDLPTDVTDDEPARDLPSNDNELVYAALRGQSIRALDILLVSPQATKGKARRPRVAKMRFDDARAYCHDLEIEGVVGWRLPDIGEAQWLSRSNMIRNGVFWTATKADAFGQERVTWNPRAKRMRTSSQRWRGGRVVCVRYQKQGDPGPQ